MYNLQTYILEILEIIFFSFFFLYLSCDSCHKMLLESMKVPLSYCLTGPILFWVLVFVFLNHFSFSLEVSSPKVYLNFQLKQSSILDV